MSGLTHFNTNAICDGNEIYDELCCDAAVNLVVEDVVDAVGAIFGIESAHQWIGFTNENDFSDLVN